MRKTIFSLVLLMSTLSSFCQQTNDNPASTQTNYFKKSKNLRTAGLILFGTGAGLIITSALIPRGDLESEGNFFGYSQSYKNDDVKSTLAVSGVVAILSSVPLFVMAGKNRKKATSVSFKMENTMRLYQQNLTRTSFPALRIKADF